jgi:hypothetical protein
VWKGVSQAKVEGGKNLLQDLHHHLKVRFLGKWVFKEFKVFFSKHHDNKEHDDVFWDCLCHDLMFWESFSLLVWSLSILCGKVCELVQLVTSHLLTQSPKQFEVMPLSPNSQTFDNLSFQFSCNVQTKSVWHLMLFCHF